VFSSLLTAGQSQRGPDQGQGQGEAEERERDEGKSKPNNQQADKAAKTAKRFREKILRKMKPKRPPSAWSLFVSEQFSTLTPTPLQVESVIKQVYLWN
jgi:hypothetical protein